MSRHLDPQDLDDAIRDVVEQVRAGLPPSFEETATKYDLRPEALRSHFERRYPGGQVGSPLPSQRDNDARKIADDVRRLLSEYGEVAKVDGRQVRLNGRLHTLIVDIPWKKRVVAYSHDTMSPVTITYSQWQSMVASRP